MRKLGILSVIVASSLFGACSSSVTDAIDGTLQKRIDTMQDCFPPLFDKLGALMEVVTTMNLNVSQLIPDPPGLTWAEQADGSIDVTYTDAGCTFEGTIVFYSPTGDPQDLDLAAAVHLSEAIDLAATELRNLFGAADKFMVLAWEMTAGGTGMGAFTAIIGGTANQNELEELRTTEVTPSGGTPPIADGSITLPTGCALTFRTASLLVDSVPDQEYPNGVVTMTIAGAEATVAATITFNMTAFATITVNDVPGSFVYDIVNDDLTYNP